MDDHDNDDANTRENILTAAATIEIYVGYDTEKFVGKSSSNEYQIIRKRVRLMFNRFF